MPRNSTIILLIVLMSLVACQRNPSLPPKLLQVAETVNNNPPKALKELEKLEKNYADAHESIRMKIALLKVKAADKSHMLQTSDSTMKAIVEYYEKHGSPNERMEAYYYLGCAYRDLCDSPKNILWYNKAIDQADTTEANFDWQLYSIIIGQLAGAYELQQEYGKTITMQRKNLQIKTQKGLDSLYSIGMLAAVLEHADSTKQAKLYYDKVLALILQRGMSEKYLSSVGMQLAFHAHYRNQQEADICLSLIRTIPMEKWPANTCSAVGLYYEQREMYDSALFYFSRGEQRYGENFAGYCNVQKVLSRIHLKAGHEHEALRYAQRHILYRDSLEKIRSKEQTLQAEKMYQYWKNENETLALERAAYKNKTFVVYLLASLVAGASIAIILVRRYKRNIRKKTAENDSLHKKIITSQSQLQEIITKQQKEKRKRNKIKVDLTNIIQLFKEKSQKKIIDGELWENFFLCIDQHYPDFKNQVDQTYGDINIEYLKFLYLQKAGLTKSATANILGVNRSTINYWCKKLNKKGDITLDDFIDKSALEEQTVNRTASSTQPETNARNEEG